MDETKTKLKILFIHKASDNHENFIEFSSTKSSDNSHILRENKFISRYWSKAIEEFKNKKGTSKCF